MTSGPITNTDVWQGCTYMKVAIQSSDTGKDILYVIILISCLTIPAGSMPWYEMAHCLEKRLGLEVALTMYHLICYWNFNSAAS